MGICKQVVHVQASHVTSLRQHVLHVLSQTINFVRQSKARRALQQVAEAQCLAVMLPNPDADMTAKSVIRKRDFWTYNERAAKLLPQQSPLCPHF